VEHGGVYGFLGPNGAGKTTTIRCILGLVAPTAGRTRVLGSETKHLHNVIDRIGSIVETPTYFPTFSGRRNLRLLGRIDGIGPDAVESVLARVGLADRADDVVKHYSLGMKQRLGIAAALLREPELLILDEPANGLDPAGIKEVRQLLRTLANEGRTVFLSSHLLGEVQQVCDHVAILARGKCIAQGPVADVLARGEAARMVVKTENLEGALQALTAAGFEAQIDADHLLVTAPASEGARITRTLATKRMYVSELRPMEVSLEDVFLELTKDNPS
jgi:ABC-2 type transport system ATP-binding protein